MRIPAALGAVGDGGNGPDRDQRRGRRRRVIRSGARREDGQAREGGEERETETARQAAGRTKAATRHEGEFGGVKGRIELGYNDADVAAMSAVMFRHIG